MKNIISAVFLATLTITVGMGQPKRVPLADVIKNSLNRSAEQALLMAESLQGQPDKLPRSFTAEGKFVTSNSDWWCSGFFPGELWYLYGNSKSDVLLDYARNYTARVEKEKYNRGTHDLGFMLYCSFGNGYRLTGDTVYREILLAAAESLASRFNPAVGCIQSWDARDVNYRWQFPVIIDNMMNLELLFWASKVTGDPKYRDICISHADMTIKHHFRSDYSSYHVVSFDPVTGQPEKKNTAQGYSDESSWARGQAWGLYGFVVMYRETKNPKYLQQARWIANYLLNHPNLPEDKIPYWDFNTPDIPNAKRDASAGAIMASALIELSSYGTLNVPMALMYLDVAETQIRTLSSPEYLAEKGTNGNFILKHSIGGLPGNSEVDVPLTYADYYFVEALSRYQALLKEKDIGPHPRILMSIGEERQIKANIAADPAWNKMHQSIIDECGNIIPLPVSERTVTGRRLLAVSNEALRRIFYLSYAYRMTGQSEYAERAEKEMLAVSAFNDWNPSHFLDVAEMTMAVAIGYDWLYDQLSPTSREFIKSAILKNGISPSFNSHNNFWLRFNNNWNQVCNAGMSFGALAIFEDMPELSKFIIDRAVESIQLPMNAYAPDGAYPEGYGYWNYGTSFNVMFLTAIEKIWKTDYGLSQIPFFMKTAGYIANMTGATGLCFNYSDNVLDGSLFPSMFWFATKTKDMSVLWDQRKYMDNEEKIKRDRLLPAIMIWGSGIRLAEVEPPKELMWVGRGITPVALMRTSWIDPNAIYVGFKGGRGSAPHGHIDAGSFVMEANGVRWASDFGTENYHLLESKGVDIWSGTQRWQVFRYNNYTHNTLTVNNQLHVVNGAADIVSYSSTAGFMNVIADMSKVFEGQLLHSLRGLAIIDGQYVVVRDEIAATDKDATVRWTMLTSAEAKITGKNSIELKKDGKKLELRVAEPANVTMKTWTTKSPNDYDSPNPGTVMVGFEVKAPAGTSTVLTVKLVPQNVKQILEKIPELKEWPKYF